MTIEKTLNGILITDIMDGQLVKQIYQGYALKDAKKKFKDHLESIKQHKR